VRRPDLDSFIPGTLYRCDTTDDVWEFVGVATMPELDGEAVGVFRFAEELAVTLIATHAGYEHGETFTPLGDAMADDIDFSQGP
jgi:hypothetical protein